MNDRPRIILAGGSGFMGRALAADFAAGAHDVVVLTRSPADHSGPGRAVYWDGKTLGDWAREIDGALAVINLAGKNVNCRYTAANRREIQESRVNAVNAVADAIDRAAVKPRVLIQSSTLAIYGDRGEEVLDESSKPGTTFSPETAILWEDAFHARPTPGTRRVILRIGFVLGRDGGALATLAALTRAFLGGRVGSGRQWISWIHMHDLARIIRRAIDDDAMEALYHVCTEHNARNADFMRELRRVLRRPWAPPTPAWAVPIGAFFMRTESELALRGRNCIPRRLTEMGFEWTFPKLRPALEDLLGRVQSAHARPH